MRLRRCRLPAITVALTLPWQILSSQGPALSGALSEIRWIGEFGRTPSALPTTAGVLLTDREEQTVLLLSGGRLDQGGLREGDGPGEIRALTGLFPYRGDSALAYGRNALRYVVLSPAGRPVRTVTLEPLDARDSLRLFMPVGGDRSGRVAFVAPRLSGGQRDSSDVVIVDLTTETHAKVGAIWAPLPPGMFGDAPESRRNNLPDPDQVVYTANGSLAVYRSRENAIHFRRANGEWRSFGLPGRTRATSRAERTALEKARDQVKLRNDSVLAQMPPESRPRLASIMASALAAMVPDRLPAYDRRGLIVIAPATVAIVRAQAVPGMDQVYDWVDGESGATGSFALSPKYRVLGAGGEKVVMGVIDENGIVRVGVLSLGALAQGGGGSRR